MFPCISQQKRVETTPKVCYNTSIKTQPKGGLRASIHLEKNGELQQVLSLLEKERSTNAEQVRYINELRLQMRDEYNYGAASERHRAEQLETQNNRIKADNTIRH